MDSRSLRDLVSVGPATEKDLQLLGISTVEQLSGCDPFELYGQLCEVLDEPKLDLCCLDVLRAAVAQARDPQLSSEWCQWWTWSQVRKGERRAPTWR